VSIGAGDVDGDHKADLIAAYDGSDQVTQVRVFSGATGQQLTGAIGIFTPFPGFTGGAWVAAGDFNSDGKADVVVGAGAGGGPQVTIFNAVTGLALQSFFPYDPGFRGGVRVATGDINGNGTVDLIVAPGAGGGPNVRVDIFDSGSPQQQLSFMAYDIGFSGGVFVASADVNGDGKADIITAPGAGGGPDIREFRSDNGALFGEYFAYDPSFIGGVFIAAG
jgi:hypothetical protein